MIKAAENLKQQQLKSEQERQKVLSQRLPQIPDIDGIEDKGQSCCTFFSFYSLDFCLPKPGFN